MLTNLIDTVMVLLLVTAVMDLVIAGLSNYRYTLKGSSDGSVSPTLPFIIPLHRKEQRVTVPLFMLINGISCLMAASLVAVILVDFAKSIGEGVPSIEMEYAIIFLWFGFTRIKRMINHQYIVNNIRQISIPKHIVIDSVDHYIGSVPKLPWIVSEVTFSNVLLAVVIGIFCSFFY